MQIKRNDWKTLLHLRRQMKRKIKAAKEALGQKWIAHPQSTHRWSR